MRFLLSGYYGFANLGDEALLEIIVAQLRARYPYAEIDVLSATPAETAHDYRVIATPRADLASVKRAIERADVVLSGGGGLLQNATSLKSLLYYAGIIRSAVRTGRKTMIFAQSIGPLDFIGKQTVRECCKGVQAATVRDERSRELLAPLLGGVPVERAADPVFLFDFEESGRRRLRVYDLGPESDPLVVVSVRKTANFTDGIGRIVAAVDRLADLGARIVFLPFGGATDAVASTAIIRRCRSTPLLLPVDDLAGAARLISRARLVIGVRLHALILAVRFGVPFLAVPYDPKVSSLCDDIAYLLPPLWTPGARAGSESDPAALAQRAWEQHDALADALAVAAVRMRELALRNFEVLDALVEGPAPSARR
ncbi:MAG TPA: polysaccharide pyruvyl transferase CsaB [Candidatus Acidoferrales bacterium]|nr:polysaccharide pyruvyl transferase CsaB [Candidatus Acidoferrales bacterium]